MPTLDWLNRASAFTTAARVPYRLLEQVSVHKGAHLVNDPYEIEKRQVGELWARKSQGRCLFGQTTKERNGVGTAGQLDALFA